MPRGIFDDAVDVRLRQEAQEIDAAAGDAGIGREGDHRNAAGARDLRGRRNRQRKQRSEDDLGAFVDRLLGALLGALRVAAIVLDQELDVGVLEFRQRHLGGILHRLRGNAGIARRRQWQDQADLDLAVAGDRRLLRRSRGARRLRITERIGELTKTLLHAGAGPEQGRAEDQANRRPPGCTRGSGTPAQVVSELMRAPPSCLFS